MSPVTVPTNMGDVTDERRELIRADPFCELLGMEVRTVAAGRAETVLELADEHLNFHGVPHGGAVYSLADAAFAAASNAEGKDAFALETNVSYLEAVDVGTTLVATAERTHEGRRTGEYEVVVRTQEGDRVATFRGRVYEP